MKSQTAAIFAFRRGYKLRLVNILRRHARNIYIYISMYSFAQNVEFCILLTVHLDVILVNDQLDALFSTYLFHISACFEQQVLIIRRIKLCQYIVWYNTLQ
jgi:hypothetical protein